MQVAVMILTHKKSVGMDNLIIEIHAVNEVVTGEEAFVWIRQGHLFLEQTLWLPVEPGGAFQVSHCLID
jgi:hypothetical protein